MKKFLILFLLSGSANAAPLLEKVVQFVPYPGLGGGYVAHFTLIDGDQRRQSQLWVKNDNNGQVRSSINGRLQELWDEGVPVSPSTTTNTDTSRKDVLQNIPTQGEISSATSVDDLKAILEKVRVALSGVQDQIGG